jgi:uncharacterized membrane protein
MAPPDNEWNEERLEQDVGNLLRAGVILAAAVVFLGGVLYLVRRGAETQELGTFHGEPESLSTLRGILRSALAFRSRGLIQLGLLLLIATPVARVALSAYGFARLRDWFYVVVTLLVLGILLFSLFGPHATDTL